MTHPSDPPIPVQQFITGNANSAELSSTAWAGLLAQAQSQGLAPLLYWKLSQAGTISSIPDFARAALREAYAATWSTNQKILQELEVLARLFDEAGIPVVVLKGACFALTIYPDIGLRPMGDLDILVPRAKLDQAVQIARALGYVDAAPDAASGLNDLIGHHACLRKLGSPAHLLEIHDSLVAEKSFTFAVPMDWFWQQTRPLEHAKYPGLRILSPTAQLLFAAAHAMLQHGGQNAPLRWFYDIDQLIRFYGQELDWQALIAQARLFEWGSALSAALARAVTCFDTPLPDPLRASLSELSDRHTGLVENKQARPETHTLIELQKLNTLTGYARLRLFMALLAPSPAYMRWRYKLKTNWTLPAWYLIRWTGILKDALLTLVAILKKRARDS
ncbi:MAG: nucleotidyltransferase family protein [Anaerolineae bacterium]|nr:nucleotidyltransferase family protein [Anaerolineae bacterium]